MEEHFSSTNSNNYNLAECSVRLTRLPLTTSADASAMRENNNVDLKNHSCEKPGQLLKGTVKSQMCNYELKYNETLMHSTIQGQQSKCIEPYSCSTCKCSFMEKQDFLNHVEICLKKYVFVNTSANISDLSNSNGEEPKDPKISSSDVSKYHLRECVIKLDRLSANLKPTDVVKLSPFNKSSKTCNSVRGTVCSKLLKNFGYIKLKDSFGCVLCSFKCQKFTNLKHHMLVHTKVRFFQCHLCECKFKYPNGLASHLSLKHTSEATTPLCCTKRFKCLNYDKKFTSKWNLAMHVSSCSKNAMGNDTIACSTLTTLHGANSDGHVQIDKHTEHFSDKNKERYATSLSKKSKQLNMDNEIKRLILVKEEPVDVYEINDCSAENKADACVKQETAEVSVDYSKPEIENLYSIDFGDDEISNNSTSSSDSNENEIPNSAQQLEKDMRSAGELLKDLGCEHDQNANVFRCNLCRCEFKYFYGIQQHMLKHSSENNKCKQCLVQFETQSNLNNHYCGDNNIQQVKKPFRCETCKHRFKLKTYFEKHVRICQQIGKKWTSASSRFANNEENRHELLQREKSNIVAENVGNENQVPESSNTQTMVSIVNYKECEKQMSVEEHQFNDNYGNTYKIENNAKDPKQMGKEEIELLDVYTNICKSENDTADLSDEKMVIGTDEEVNDFHKVNISLGSDTITTATPAKNSYKCEKCEKGFVRAYELNRHLKTHSDEKPFECQFCKNRYKDERYFSYHMKSHHLENQGESFHCKVCSKPCATPLLLKKHLKYHKSHDLENQDESYCCEVCTKGGFSLAQLKNHMRYHKEKKYKCHLCEWSFSIRGYLKRHLLTHTGEKSFACHLCERRYTTKSSLLYHLKSHVGDKPFKCSDCNKAFIRQSQLKCHIWHKHNKIIDSENQSESSYFCRVCSKPRVTPVHLKKHMQSHEKKFKCHLCEWSFSIRAHLKRHLLTHTGEKSFACHLCEKRYTTKSSLLYHLKSHIGDKPFKCSDCSKAFIQQSQLKCHLWHKHTKNIDSENQSGSSYFCKVCSKPRVTPVHLKKHMQPHEKKFKCHLCELSFAFKQNLKRHLVTHTYTREMSFNCHLCTKRYKTKESLSYHMMSHTEDKPYKCGECDKAFIKQLQLKYHLWCTHMIPKGSIGNSENQDESSYYCKVCTKRCLNHYDLKRHMQSHEKPHKCHLCGWSFSSKESWKLHLLTHLGKTSFKCHLCDKYYKDRNSFWYHMRSHTGDKPFKCSDCNKAFIQKSQLKYHLWHKHNRSIDNSENQAEYYYCKVCSKPCITPLHLKRHLQSHEKPYKCHLCGSSFSIKTNLKRHVVSHTGAKSFKCHLCDKRYTAKESLLYHIKSHTGEKPFKCNKCDYASKLSKQLKIHCLRKHHSNSPEIIGQEMIVAAEIPCRTNNTLHTMKNIEIVMPTENDEKVQPKYNLEWQQSIGVNQTTADGYSSASYTSTGAETITDTKSTVNLEYKECDDVPGRRGEMKNTAAKLKQIGIEELETDDTFGNFFEVENNAESSKQTGKEEVEYNVDTNFCKAEYDAAELNEEKIIIETDDHTNESHKIKLENIVKTELTSNMNVSSDTDLRFKCSECGKAFVQQSQLKYHLWNVHNSTSSIDKSENQDDFYYCHICSKPCLTPSLLKCHIQCHEKPYKCHLCELSFSIKANLKRHLVSHTGEKSFKCDLCEKKYTTKASLLYHVKSHTGEKPFKCNKCDYTTKLNKELKAHCLRKHRSKSSVNTGQEMKVVDEQSNEEIPYQTSTILEAINVDTTTATEHDEEIQPTRNLKCKQSEGVNKTVAKNSHECEKCKKVFAMEYYLKRHLMAHSDERPYECNFCQNRYKHKLHLNDHIKSRNLENQSDEKSYKCHLCKSSFSRKHSLNRHLLIHTGESPFKCNKCDYIGTRSNDVKKHCLRKHACNFSVNTDQAIIIVNEQSKVEIPCQTNNNLHTIQNIETVMATENNETIEPSETTNVDSATTLHALAVAETITDAKCTVNLDDKECDDMLECCGETKNKAAELKQMGVEEHGFDDTYEDFCEVEDADVSEDKIIIENDDGDNESHKIKPN